MAISTSTNFARVLGNGSTTTFNFGFVADSADYISVDYYSGSTFIETISTSLYTLFINPPAVGQIWGVGGTVTYPLTGSPIANGTSLLIQRTLPLTQIIGIGNQGNFSPEVIEEALDTLCMQIQQIAGTDGEASGVTAAEIIGALGYTPMNGANNLSEITTAATARTNLGLGSMSMQAASAVAVTGGTLSGVNISGSSFSGNAVLSGLTSSGGATIIGALSHISSTGTGLSSLVTNGGSIDFTVIGSGAFAVDAPSVSLTASTDFVMQNGDSYVQTSGSNLGISADAGNLELGALTAITFSQNIQSTAAAKGITLKRGANGRVGTVTLTGTTAVTVSNTSIATSDIISFSLAVVGGTVGSFPTIKTITAASGFTVAGSAGDTSTYNFCITKSVI